MKIKYYWEKVRLWARLHPDGLWTTLWLVLFIAFHIIALFQSVHPIMVISENALYQTVGIGAQIVAGLYGITLTGYIFFLEHLQQLKKENKALHTIIDALKKRYHTMVKVISIYVVAVVILSMILMIYGTSNTFFPEMVTRFLVYENCILALTSTGFIVYFVMNVVDPDKIQKISFQYKERLSSSENERGDIKTFMRDYSEIEQLLKKYSNETSDTYLNEMPLKDILLLKTEWKESLIDDVLKLTNYYNYLLFSQEMIVSKEMCVLVKELKIKLTSK